VVGNKGGYCFIYEFVYDNLVFLQLITIFDLPFYLKKIHSKKVTTGKQQGLKKCQIMERKKAFFNNFFISRKMCVSVSMYVVFYF